MAGSTSSPNAISYNVSLYAKHIEKIQKHKGKKKFKSDAAALQNIIENHTKHQRISLKKDAIILIIYPAILSLLCIYAARSMTGVMGELIAKNYTHIGELATLETIFTSLGFITFGVLAAFMILFFNQMKRSDE